MPACSAVLREVKTLAEPPVRLRPSARLATADAGAAEGAGLIGAQPRHSTAHAATSAASSLRFHVP